jgi:energy-coupling factor transport system permease protein
MLKERLLIGQYYAADSLIHRLNAAVKIIATMIYLVVLFVVDDWWGWGALALLAVTAVIISRVPWRALWRGLKLIAVIAVFTMLLNIFLYPGEALWSWGPLTFSLEGLSNGLAMGLRLILLVLFASLMTLTTTPIALTDGLEQLLKPLKIIGVPAQEIAMMMTIALRFIPTILEEFDRIALAQRARGAIIGEGNLLRRISSAIPLLVPLFISAFRRAEDLAAAMEARCYRGGAGRSKWRQAPWRAADTAVLAAFVFIFAGSIVYRVL